MEELFTEIVADLVAALAAPVVDFVLRWIFWLLATGVRMAAWLGVEGLFNWLHFYRDLWLRVRWTRRRLSRPR